MGLRLGCSFEIDSLHLKLIEEELIISQASPTQIIKSVGIVGLDGTWIYRFYTDDDAFLQVIAEGGCTEECVVDVKLFHFYDTRDISSNEVWEKILSSEIGVSEYELENHKFRRVWTSTGDYHNPVHMREKTYDDDQGEPSETDQFTMLFERDLKSGQTESLFLSAEEIENEGNLERCFVLSTGITLTPSQLHIHG